MHECLKLHQPAIVGFQAWRAQFPCRIAEVLASARQYAWLRCDSRRTCRSSGKGPALSGIPDRRLQTTASRQSAGPQQLPARIVLPVSRERPGLADVDSRIRASPNSKSASSRTHRGRQPKSRPPGRSAGRSTAASHRPPGSGRPCAWGSGSIDGRPGSARDSSARGKTPGDPQPAIRGTAQPPVRVGRPATGSRPEG